MSGDWPEGVEEGLRRGVKAELRKRMRGLRTALPRAARQERSRRIVDALIEHPFLVGKSRIALFWPMASKGEVDLSRLDVLLRKQGISRVAYPAIAAEGETMIFRWVEDTNDLAEAGFGFEEPPSSAKEVDRAELEVIVVPALALAPSGHRIGYGAGYYDRALPRFVPPAKTIGVGYDFQLIAEVPVTGGDVALDSIVTDVRVLFPDG